VCMYVSFSVRMYVCVCVWRVCGVGCAGTEIWTVRVGMLLQMNAMVRPAWLPVWFTVADVFLVAVAGMTVLYQLPSR
jgi:hypothetical protein